MPVERDTQTEVLPKPLDYVGSTGGQDIFVREGENPIAVDPAMEIFIRNREESVVEPTR